MTGDRRDVGVRVLTWVNTAVLVLLVAPEVVLLFKAKNARERDEHDLNQALPRLSADERAWLHDAIALVHPGHPWLTRLHEDQN